MIIALVNYLGHLGTEDTNMTLVNITAFEQPCSGNGQEGDYEMLLGVRVN